MGRGESPRASYYLSADDVARSKIGPYMVAAIRVIHLRVFADRRVGDFHIGRGYDQFRPRFAILDFSAEGIDMVVCEPSWLDSLQRRHHDLENLAIVI